MRYYYLHVSPNNVGEMPRLVECRSPEDRDKAADASYSADETDVKAVLRLDVTPDGTVTIAGCEQEFNG